MAYAVEIFLFQRSFEMAKKGFLKPIAYLLVLVACVTTLHAQTLDAAIKNAANEMSEKLQRGSTIAVASFKSESSRLTDYVIDELNGSVVTIGDLKVVERRRLDAIRDELNLNMSGEISDESAQRIGRMFGAQNIVIGSIEIIGNVYRIRFQAISTEGATIQYSFSENIKNDSVLETLLAGSNTLVDFTPTQRMTASALNLAFGAGSFLIEGDKLGGGITAGVEGVGVVLFIYALAQYNSKISQGLYAADKEWDYTRDELKTTKTLSIESSYEAYPYFIGIAAYTGGAIFGAIRAQIYHKPGSRIAHTPLDGLKLDLVADHNSNAGLQVSYTWRS
jgi:hypothetical protein